MKKVIAIVLALVLAMGCMTALAMTKEEAEQAANAVVSTTTDKSLITSPFIPVIAKVQDSVVGVNNYQNYTYSNYSIDPFDFGFGFGFGFGGGGYGNGRGNDRSNESVEKLAATGSGVVIYDGVVLTNYHVVEDAERLTVSVDNREDEYDCTLISYDKSLDVAIVYAPELKLPAVELADSDQLQVGEWVVCIGNPLSDELRRTVTTGIVSALNREIGSTTTTDKYGLKTTVTNTMIQTDAAINSGNSGGGMFNMLGQLIGIPSLKYSGQTSSGADIDGIAMAIPVNSAKPVITEALVKVLTGTIAKADDVSGKEVTESGDKPMLGVSGSMITSSNNYAVSSGLLPGGMEVVEVTEGGPADLAGIEPYDIIVEIDGEIVTGMTVIRSALDAHAYGDTIKVKVYRAEGLADAVYTTDIGKGEYIEVEVTLAPIDEKL